MAITFGGQVCGDLAAGTSREWLVPDGCGGYAMGTVSGLRTRSYHGLLVVSGDRLAQRRLGLAALDPVLESPSGAQIPLGSHEWVSGAVEPAGHTLLERFDLVDGLPRWRYRVGGVVLERELATVHGRPALGVVHRLRSGGPVRLRLRALCTWRDSHAQRYAGHIDARSAVDGVEIDGGYRLAGPGWQPVGTWWRGAYLREEAARGLNPTEDLWYAGDFTATLERPGQSLDVCAWAGAAEPTTPAGQPLTAIDIVAAAHRRNRTVDPATDMFIVATPTGPDVVAGYPWFGAWSRDTMISYEGLFLSTGRSQEGRDLLRAYAATLSEGMLANTADTGDVSYNTADGTLWFVHAVGRHVARTGDTDLAHELLPALDGIIQAHRGGTRYGIRVDPSDGLLAAGAPGEALTWMDARVDGRPVTPRAGKPVELSALWCNALGTVAALRGQQPPGLPGFGRAYHHDQGLLDAVGDPSPRPNQLLAYSLPFGPMYGQPISPRITAELLTPLGLRSLAPGAPGYRGAHRGDMPSRDRAYHQGTVWPWLIGPYLDAVRSAPQAARWPGTDPDTVLAGLAAHLTEYGLGSISETADGDPPHGATGCPFQAWSVAEFRRVSGS